MMEMRLHPERPKSPPNGVYPCVLWWLQASLHSRAGRPSTPRRACPSSSIWAGSAVSVALLTPISTREPCPATPAPSLDS